MVHRAFTAAVCTLLLASLAGCPSGGGAPEAGTPAPGQTTSTSSGAPPVGGPLASLDPNAAKPETWQLDKGPVPFLNWEAQHLRISASCRQPNGQLDCEALRFVRGGPSVELTPQDRARMVPPGAIACKKIGNQLTTGRDPAGNEDGFCIFRDGSMISNGSLQSYAIK